MPRSRQPPPEYVLEGATKDVNRYSTPALQALVRELGDASQRLEQVNLAPGIRGGVCV
jgi:hypothetical protein